MAARMVEERRRGRGQRGAAARVWKAGRGRAVGRKEVSIFLAPGGVWVGEGTAIEGTPWEALKPCMKGMNAWLFVHTEEVPAALKPYRAFQKEERVEDTNDFIGAVFEGKYYQPADFKALETMPTRAEVYSKLLGALNGPATGLVTTLQAPAREVVAVLSAYVRKLEEEAGAGAA